MPDATMPVPPGPNPQAIQQMLMGPMTFFDEQAKLVSANIQNSFNALNQSTQSALSAIQSPFTPRSPSLIQELATAPGKALKAIAGNGNTPAPTNSGSPARPQGVMQEEYVKNGKRVAVF